MNFKIISLSILAAASAQGVVVGTWATDWLNPDTTTGGITAGAAALGGGLVAQAFETVDPAGNHTFVDVAATHGATGQWLYGASSAGNTFTATLTLSNVPAFQSVSINRGILGIGGGADGTLHGDGFSISVNGTDIFNDDFAARVDADGRWAGSYGESAPAGAVLEGGATGDTNGSEFLPGRTDGWGHDALFDVGADPAFDNVLVSGSGDVTIVITGRLFAAGGPGTSEGGTDEQLSIGNLELEFDTVPEPTSALLVGLGALGLFRRRR